MKYRDHKGSLALSMETEQEFESKAELISYLNEFYNHFLKEVIEIKFDYCEFDSRIGWDTYYVSCKIDGDEDFRFVGYSNGILI